MTVTEFAKAHRELFAKTTKEDEVLDKEIERTDSWKHEKKSEMIGYFVYVGNGKGDFSVGPYEAPNKKCSPGKINLRTVGSITKNSVISQQI